MAKGIVIVGAGRQGRNVLEILGLDPAGRPVAGFLDDTKPVGAMVMGAPVLGGFGLMGDPAFVAAHAWFVAIGDGRIRQAIGLRLKDGGATIVNALHPSASISPSAVLGVGIYAAAFARIATQAQIGDWLLAESHCFVGEDARIGSGVSFGPNCAMAGGVSIGEVTFLGAGTVVSNDVTIGAGCVIGANSTVLRDIADGKRAYGSPARNVGQALR